MKILQRLRLGCAAALLGLACLAQAAVTGERLGRRAEVRAFLEEMAQKHGFPRAALHRWFRDLRSEPRVLALIAPAADPGVRSWSRYRERYLDTTRIAGGVRFWRDHAGALAEAQRRFGVPAEIIVAILGVETIYGRNTGRFPALAALATLAFDYPPRAQLFRRELEELLLLAREQGRSPLAFRGSYAGALGLAQFLPSSYRRHALDFDGDGRIDLSASPEDAIGSIARFLSDHGWVSGAGIALPARLADEHARILVDAGIAPVLTAADLDAWGVQSEPPLAPGESAALIDLVTPGEPAEYWLGLQNFYVLTRYNRSSFYAMTVHQLGRELAAACERKCDGAGSE
ncbi:MAG: lytic murein transglycosylase B [Rhodocyclaceae bacterium]